MPEIPQSEESNPLAAAVAHELETRGWTLRQAANATGVPYSTIDRMSKGNNVEAEAIIKFALKIASNDNRFQTVLRWLEMGRKIELARLLRELASLANTENIAGLQVEDSQTIYSAIPAGLEAELHTFQNPAIRAFLLQAFQSARTLEDAARKAT